MKDFLLTRIIILIVAILTSLVALSQDTVSVNYQISFDESIGSELKSSGRLFIFYSTSPFGEPRYRIWPSPGGSTKIFAKNFVGINEFSLLTIDSRDEWLSSSKKESPDKVIPGKYYIQVLWDQDNSESRINAYGNFYSQVQNVSIQNDTIIKLNIVKSVDSAEEPVHEMVRWVNFKSDTLSAWWSKDMYLKASVLLPFDYDQNKTYPIRYNVAGYGGRYTRINRLVNNNKFMSWWNSEEAPQFINVFLDGEGPFGDSYQMDSDNSGPYGTALINELIPFIESKYRGSSDASLRFVDGCSTGGWVSLALQLYYPDQFNGVFSYSPDAVEFENYQLINIYKDQNAFINEYGNKRPVWREKSGEPVMMLEDFIQYENVLGRSDNYLTSGGQFSAHTALYSPKGENGFPKALFDPLTGEIDQEVAEHWKKYDMKIYASENWTELGPKIKGKVYIWMGDMDNFYLNPATRSFSSFLESTQNPASDAVIEFSPMEGHCSQFSHRRVLEQMQLRLESLRN